MSRKTYEAAKTLFRARALEALSVIESLLAQPATPSTISEIKKQTEKLAKHEASLITLNQYFGATFEAPAAPPQAPKNTGNDPSRSGPPKKVTPEMSTTYRKSIEKEKIKQSGQPKTPKESKKK